MKLLPCRGSCDDRIAKTGPRRTPYYASSYPGRGDRMAYVCRGCGGKLGTLHTITPAEFNALPEATAEQLEAAGILDHLAKDMTLGGQLEPEHARDLFLAGLTPHELAALPEQE